MRITDGIRYLRSIKTVAEAALRFDRAARVAATGKRVELPSDGPAAYASMLAHSERLKRLDVRAEVLGRTTSDLEIAEGSLASATDVVAHVREIAVQMANGTLNAADRTGAAAEVRSLRATLSGLANSKGQNGYLFGGTRVDTAPFDTNAVYQGNLDALRVEVADGVTESVSLSGADAFTASGVNGRDAFVVLDALTLALGANDLTGIRDSLDAIDGVLGQLSNVRADAGAKIDRLRAAQAFATDTTLLVAKGRAAAVEADPIQAFSELTRAKTAYEQSLEVTKKLLALSSLGQ